MSLHVEKIYKKDEEAYGIQVSFENKNPNITYTIADLNVTAVDSDGNDATATVIDAGKNGYSGSTATAWIRGGTSDETYLIDVTATMTGGEVFTQRLKLIVSD